MTNKGNTSKEKENKRAEKGAILLLQSSCGRKYQALIIS
jgi:hypothetical protein